jgi:hypothetical protein
MRRNLLLTLLLLLPIFSHGQSLQSQLQTWAEEYSRTDCYIKPSKVEACDIDNENKTIRIEMGGGFPEQFFTPEVVDNIYKQVR